MPVTLEASGIVQSVRELCNHSRYTSNMRFDIREHDPVPKIPKELAIDLFRVTQEFIANAIKHGKANRIGISFSVDQSELKIVLKENRKGYDCNTVCSGLGLRNVESRVKSHNGAILITSKPGKGTSYSLNIPLPS